MAALGLQTPDPNNELIGYQLGRYVGCNEVILCIFSSPIHQRYLSVTQFSVRMETVNEFISLQQIPLSVVKTNQRQY